MAVVYPYTSPLGREMFAPTGRYISWVCGLQAGLTMPRNSLVWRRPRTHSDDSKQIRHTSVQRYGWLELQRYPVVLSDVTWLHISGGNTEESKVVSRVVRSQMDEKSGSQRRSQSWRFKRHPCPAFFSFGWPRSCFSSPSAILAPVAQFPAEREREPVPIWQRLGLGGCPAVGDIA